MANHSPVGLCLVSTNKPGLHAEVQHAGSQPPDSGTDTPVVILNARSQESQHTNDGEGQPLILTMPDVCLLGISPHDMPLVKVLLKSSKLPLQLPEFLSMLRFLVGQLLLQLSDNFPMLGLLISQLLPERAGTCLCSRCLTQAGCLEFMQHIGQCVMVLQRPAAG